MPKPELTDAPAPNSYWVVPGSFAAGEYPGDVDPARAAKRLMRLLEAGIDHFINLTQPHELEPYDAIAEEQARTLGITVGHERHSIVDLNTPDSPRYMTAILDAIDSSLAAGKTIYVHCWAGVGRTGTVVGCWLVRHGRTGDEALAQIAEWWEGMDQLKKSIHPTSPETSRQKTYVRNWAEPLAH